MTEPLRPDLFTLAPTGLLAAAGHYWTLAPVARHTLRPRSAPRAVPWSITVDDPKLGRVRLTGLLDERPGRGTGGLVVIVHGLGGDVGSHYAVAAARAAAAAGLSSLRLNLRGADLSGEGLYHAGLITDIHAALASPELAPYERLYLLGYSLGGHLALSCAAGPLDRRVRAVAAVCPPLDLHAGSRAIDEPRRVFYRRYVLGALQAHYTALARRHPTPLPVAEARRITRVRAWDDRVVAPWFGFRSADHYYAEVSVAPRLSRVALPGLIVEARHDPMVPEFTVRPALEQAGAPLEIRWLDRGGHVGFPRSVDLGMGGPLGLEPQVIAWLSRHA